MLPSTERDTWLRCGRGGLRKAAERQGMHDGEKRRQADYPLRAWKLTIAYDGTDFRGWQVQPGLPTIQGELANAVFQVTGERVLPQGSGRTDAGVHAEAQAVSLALEAAIPPDRLRTAMNRRLPAAIRVVTAEHAPTGFHARAGVRSKVYEYRLFLRQPATGSAERTLMPWQARFVWDCRFALDIKRMQAAAGDVVGTFNFTSFAAFDPDRAARLGQTREKEPAPTNVRTIFTSDWVENDGLVLYRVSGSGFLHHMVRNLVGTFIEIGMGIRAVDCVPAVLAAQNRSAAGPTAPPQGLFLMSVQYASAAAVAQVTDQGFAVECS